MLSKDGSWRGTLGAAAAASEPAPSNDAGPAPTQRQLDELRRGCVAVDAALESIAAPAFLIDRTGAVRQANDAGRRVLAFDAVSLAASLATAAATKRPTDEWCFEELSAGDPAGSLLAILRTRAPRIAATDPIQKARLRWKLTKRQAQVLDFVARGLTNALVAEVLGISEGTVEYHLTALFDKAGVCNRATLIVRLLELARR